MMLFFKKLGTAMKAACGAAALLVAATSAQATEPDYTNFNGFYAGIQGGYSSGQIELYDSRIGGMDVGISGFYGGVHAGYGHNILERAYLGFEADYNWHKDSSGDAFIVHFDKKRDYSAAVRLGFLASEDTMVYLKGGVHAIEVEAMGDSEIAVGVLGGMGIEYIVWNGISVRAEGKYTNVKVDDLKYIERVSDASLSLGISYRF